MLIKRRSRDAPNPPIQHFETPLVGSVNDTTPVSADVHLYADPTTFFDQCPALFADCEGLEGGESTPRAEALREQVNLAGNTAPNSHRRRGQHVSRKISWALDDLRKSTRQFAVGQLYPKLLFTFSDVVVFVLRNPKYVEATFSPIHFIIIIIENANLEQDIRIISLAQTC